MHAISVEAEEPPCSRWYYVQFVHFLHRISPVVEQQCRPSHLLPDMEIEDVSVRRPAELALRACEDLVRVSVRIQTHPLVSPPVFCVSLGVLDSR
jgi:hypothetical protein